VEAFEKAFREVIGQGMAKADWEAGLVWIPKAIEHNRPASPNVVTSWANTWDLIPECGLKLEAYQGLKAFLEGMHKGFAKAFTEACRMPSAKPCPNQEQDQDQEQEQKKRREAPNPPPPLFALGEPSVPRDRDDVHRKIFDAWISARGKRYPSVRHHEPKLDEERRGAIDAALKLGYSVDKLCQSVVGFVQNADRDCSDPRTFVWALKDSSSIDSGCERWLKANPESQTRMTTVEAAKQAIG
jgi:hypothetical protein